MGYVVDLVLPFAPPLLGNIVAAILGFGFGYFVGGPLYDWFLYREHLKERERL